MQVKAGFSGFVELPFWEFLQRKYSSLQCSSLYNFNPIYLIGRNFYTFKGIAQKIIKLV